VPDNGLDIEGIAIGERVYSSGNAAGIALKLEFLPPSNGL